MLAGVDYVRVDDEGLHMRINGEPSLLPVDTIVVCAGQEPARSLYNELDGLGLRAHLIGGALEAAEIDAKRAIRQATDLAAEL